MLILIAKPIWSPTKGIRGMTKTYSTRKNLASGNNFNDPSEADFRRRRRRVHVVF